MKVVAPQLTSRARRAVRGLRRGRRIAFITLNGMPVTGPLYTVKEVKRLYRHTAQRLNTLPSIGVFTNELWTRNSKGAP